MGKHRKTANLMSLVKLAERDGYICWLCKRDVDMTLQHPHRMAPTRDHVRKVSEGGSNNPLNLRLAHAVCNEQREGDGLFAKTPPHVRSKRRFPHRPANWSPHKNRTNTLYDRRTTRLSINEQAEEDEAV